MNQCDIFDSTMVDAIIGTGGTPDSGRAFLEQVLDLSFSRADVMLSQIYAANAAAADSDVRRAAHQLISSLGNLGAVEMVGLCRAIQANPEYATEVAALPPAYERFRAALFRHITR